MITSRSSGVQPGTTNGVLVPSPCSVSSTPPRRSSISHCDTRSQGILVVGRPRHLISMPVGERAMSKTSALRAASSREDRDAPDGGRGRRGTGSGSTARPGQLAQGPVADQGCPVLVEQRADPILLADHLVVVDPGPPVVGGQRAQLGRVDGRVQEELGDAGPEGRACPARRSGGSPLRGRGGSGR